MSLTAWQLWAFVWVPPVFGFGTSLLVQWLLN